MTNLYRWLAGLNSVTINPGWIEGAQQCALMMYANALSHSPSPSSTCFTAAGASAAGLSNLAGYAGIASVDAYMGDGMWPNNVMGHRRWILSDISQVAFGSVCAGSTAGRLGKCGSCMRVIGSNPEAQPHAWSAFPPPGPVPFDLFNQSSKLPIHVDAAGWHVQSSTINLWGAKVSVLLNGRTNLPVQTLDLQANYGSQFGIGFSPKGWSTQPYNNYTVTVACAGGQQVITYTVYPVAC
jgi:hypothetical protein